MSGWVGECVGWVGCLGGRVDGWMGDIQAILVQDRGPTHPEFNSLLFAMDSVWMAVVAVMVVLATARWAIQAARAAEAAARQAETAAAAAAASATRAVFFCSSSKLGSSQVRVTCSTDDVQSITTHAAGG